MSFSNIIHEIDNFKSNENDFIFKSAIKFEYSQEKDYNSEIMEFLNYIIGLPNKHIKEVSKSMGECFNKDMENIFAKIYQEK